MNEIPHIKGAQFTPPNHTARIDEPSEDTQEEA